MTAKQRKDGSGSYFLTPEGWRAQVRYFDEFTGKSKQIRRRAKNRDHARELLKDLRKEAGLTTPDRNDGLTVADYLTVWARDTMPVSGIKASTQRTYTDLITSPLTPTLGVVRLDRFTSREAELWLQRLDLFRTKPRHPKPTKANPEPKPEPGRLLAQSTKRQAFAVLSLALRTAARDGLIESNPLADVARPRKGATEVPVMTSEQVEKLLSAKTTRASIYWPLVVFVANTGVRIGEALALRWNDVDLDAGTATIRQGSLDGNGTKTAAGKRTVPLLPDVVAALRERRRQQASHRLKMGSGWKDTRGLVFTTGEGTPVDPHNARRTLRGLLKAAGLPTDRPWHTMRHSLATRLLNRGVPMPVVSQIIGHASIRTTVDIYGHAEPAISAAALAEAMGK